MLFQSVQTYGDVCASSLLCGCVCEAKYPGRVQVESLNKFRARWVSYSVHQGFPSFKIFNTKGDVTWYLCFWGHFMAKSHVLPCSCAKIWPLNHDLQMSPKVPKGPAEGSWGFLLRAIPGFFNVQSTALKSWSSLLWQLSVLSLPIVSRDDTGCRPEADALISTCYAM